MTSGRIQKPSRGSSVNLRRRRKRTKKLSPLEAKALKIVKRYRREYRAPASSSDVSELMRPKLGEKKASRILQSLKRKGFVTRRPVPGWIATRKGLRSQTHR